MQDYRVRMHSRSAMNRTIYDVDVRADSDDNAAEAAIDRIARIHGQHDWVIERIECLRVE